jgi:hypothetical protein
MLMGKKVLAFIWLYLLVRRLLEPAGWVQRSAFAEEFSRGLSVKRQSKGMRDRVGDILRRDLPEVLASRLIVDRQAMRLELSNCSIDVVRLEEVARQCADQKGMLTGDLVAEARRMLDETEGEFLPGWEEIEAEANGGQGAAKEYVRALREVAETARVDLMGALAANHIARQEPRKRTPLSISPIARTWHGNSGPPTWRPASTRERLSFRRNTPWTLDLASMQPLRRLGAFTTEYASPHFLFPLPSHGRIARRERRSASL